MTDIIAEEANFVENKSDAQTIAQAPTPSASPLSFTPVSDDSDLPF